jgi:hypothetical protein
MPRIAEETMLTLNQSELQLGADHLAEFTLSTKPC